MSKPHKPIPVKGYTEQSELSVEFVNDMKGLEAIILCLIDLVSDSEEIEPDPNWIAIGRTQIEQGVMAVNRAIMKPEKVVPDELKALSKKFKK